MARVSRQNPGKAAACFQGREPDLPAASLASLAPAFQTLACGRSRSHQPTSFLSARNSGLLRSAGSLQGGAGRGGAGARAFPGLLPPAARPPRARLQRELLLPRRAAPETH